MQQPHHLPLPTELPTQQETTQQTTEEHQYQENQADATIHNLERIQGRTEKGHGATAEAQTEAQGQQQGSFWKDVLHYTPGRQQQTKKQQREDPYPSHPPPNDLPSNTPPVPIAVTQGGTDPNQLNKRRKPSSPMRPLTSPLLDTISFSSHCGNGRNRIHSTLGRLGCLAIGEVQGIDFEFEGDDSHLVHITMDSEETAAQVHIILLDQRPQEIIDDPSLSHGAPRVYTIDAAIAPAYMDFPHGIPPFCPMAMCPAHNEGQTFFSTIQTMQQHIELYHPDLITAMTQEEREAYQWYDCPHCHEYILGTHEYEAHTTECPSKPPTPTPTRQSDPFRAIRRLCPPHKAELLEEEIANGISRNDAYDLVDTWIDVEDDNQA